MKEGLVEKVVVKEDHERDRWVKKIEEGEETVLALLRLLRLSNRMERLEGRVKGVGREVSKKGKGKEVVRRDEAMLAKLRKRDEEGMEDKEEAEEEVGRVMGQLALARKFVYVPNLKGNKVDFGAIPPSPKGDTIFG